MAEEFQGGVCGDTWWNPPRNMFSSGDGGGWLSPCSVAQLGGRSGSGGGYDMTNFGWTNEAMKDNGLVCDMMSTMVFQADLDSTFDIFGFGPSSISSPTDWNQSNLLCNGGDDENFELMIQDDINSRNCCEMTTNSPTIMNSNNFMIDNNNSFGQEGSSPMTMTTSSNSSEDSSTINNELSNLNTSFYMSSYLIQTLFDDTNDPQLIDPNYGEPMSSNELVNHGQGSKGQYFEDTTLSNIEVSMMNSLLSRSRTSKSKKMSNNCSNLVTKVTNEDICDSNGNINEQPPAKRPRIETPSSLPTFKVRKEKLGDRITALQQIVSPFGKTDTASVLHEAIEYIRFLHDQVNALSTPYMKNNGAAIQQQQDFDMLKNKNERKQDLRSQGLCLMPISSTYPIAQETPVDFWTPTFGTSPLL